MHAESRPDPTPQPHREAASWPGLIAGLGIDAILVVITGWMGPRLRREMSVEDIWQDTLAMAWRDRGAHAWIDPASYRRWLLAIARNRVRDAAKTLGAKKRDGDRTIASLSYLDSQSADDGRPVLPADTLTPSRVATRRERMAAMAGALATLPDVYREAVRKRLFEQLPLADVAAALSVSLATAKKRIYLGAQLYRTLLRARLSQLPASQRADA